ncbi:peroxiredoxin family protein [Leptospira ryugenii]|nr:TlpA disulfide reductase family protein [Leptospira ryugenii]
MEEKNSFSFLELEAYPWLLTEPIRSEKLRGNVIVLYAFQMLCPSCILHGSPFAQKIHQTFADKGVKVIGIHTVFEHHNVMGPDALETYLAEFRYSFPVVIDKHNSPHPIPDVMRRLELQGTPSFLLFDKAGNLRSHYFGPVDPLSFGYEIGKLIAE